MMISSKVTSPPPIYMSVLLPQTFGSGTETQPICPLTRLPRRWWTGLKEQKRDKTRHDYDYRADDTVERAIAHSSLL